MKELKYVKLYEGFLLEKVLTLKTVKINKNIRDTIKLAAQLNKDLKSLVDAYKAKIEPMEDTLRKYDTEILNTLTNANKSSETVENIIATVMSQEGRLTDSYKTLWLHALDSVNAETRKSLLAFQEQSKKQNATTHWMSYKEINNESLKDIAGMGKNLLDKFKAWVKDVWSKLKKVLDERTKAIDNLETLANKITSQNK